MMKRAVRKKNARSPVALPAMPGQQRVNPLIIDDRVIVNPLKWASLFMDWEILIYDRKHTWEACFFKSTECHEHLTGFSLDDARLRAEARIRVLEFGSVRVRRRGDRATLR